MIYKSLKKTFPKPLEKARMSLLADRLKTSEKDAGLRLRSLEQDIANILGITDTGIYTELEFSGRELDLVFTINKQNTPKNK
ncbi:MAG: hypothetical protein Kow0029_17630 [Candidatus Rifleibacteriota bacterium]